MRKIYGIFNFKYSDEKELHSAYVSRELAERELRILDMTGKTRYGRIEEIRLCEDEGDLDEKPDTFEVQGTVENKRDHLDIEIYKERYLYERDVKTPKNPYEISFCLRNYKMQLYGFSVLLPGSLIDAPNNEVERIVKKEFPVFQKQFGELLQNTRIRVNPRFANDSTKFRLQTQLKLDFLENQQKDPDVFESIYYSNKNVASVYDDLCQEFCEIIMHGFEEMLNNYMHGIADATMLKAIREDFANEASQFSWFDPKDPMNLDKCFRCFLMQGQIWE